MIDCIAGYHLNPWTCGIAKFNEIVAKVGGGKVPANTDSKGAGSTSPTATDAQNAPAAKTTAKSTTKRVGTRAQSKSAPAAEEPSGSIAAPQTGPDPF